MGEMVSGRQLNRFYVVRFSISAARVCASDTASAAGSAAELTQNGRDPEWLASALLRGKAPKSAAHGARDEVRLLCSHPLRSLAKCTSCSTARTSSNQRSSRELSKHRAELRQMPMSAAEGRQLPLQCLGHCTKTKKTSKFAGA
jgi:hypothetical protein